MKWSAKVSRSAAKVHRALGTVLVLLMVVWFCSGVVMVFWGYPQATLRERLSLSVPIHAADLEGLTTRTIFKAIARGEVLRMFRGPSGLVVVGPDSYRDATGRALARSTPERCLAHVVGANPWLHTAFRQRITEPGQWTVPESIRSRLPLYMFETRAGERHYVDPYGCALIQHSTAAERFWAYLGAIPHWLYIAPLRIYRQTWRWLIVALAAIGLVLCTTGLYRGAVILRFPRGAGRIALPRSPLVRPILRVHHLAGLFFGAFAFTWLLSGAMSLSPFELGPSRTSTGQAQRGAMLGAGVQPLTLRPVTALQSCLDALDEVRLMEVIAVAGVPYYLCYDADGETRLVHGAQRDSVRSQQRLSVRSLEAAARYALGAPPVGAGMVAAADTYHYPSHQAVDFELPFFRASFNDREQTTLYISPSTGTISRHVTQGSRWQRFLYHGLHSLDFPWLYRRPWLWHLTILTLLLGGIVLTASAWMLARRRWQRSWQRYRSRG